MLKNPQHHYFPFVLDEMAGCPGRTSDMTLERKACLSRRDPFSLSHIAGSPDLHGRPRVRSLQPSFELNRIINLTATTAVRDHRMGVEKSTEKRPNSLLLAQQKGELWQTKVQPCLKVIVLFGVFCLCCLPLSKTRVVSELETRRQQVGAGTFEHFALSDFASPRKRHDER